MTAILTEDSRAVGARLEDGMEERSDMVISDADARTVILRMLNGNYMDGKIRYYYAEPDDVTPWAAHVFLGVNREISEEPSALVQLLAEPVTIANRTMAPEGKSVIKVELFSSYSHWKKLYEDRIRYDEERRRGADQVIELLEATHFPGLRSQVEVVDVPTMMTWKRYMGGSHGFMTLPAKKFSPMKMLCGRGYATLPGLADFYQVGAWATEAGALFSNALSGRKTIAHLCKQHGKTFELADAF